MATGRLIDLLNLEHPEEVIKNGLPFTKILTQYHCAMLEVKTKLDVLNAELSLESDHNPFESIHCRLKKPISIVEKLKRNGLDISVENIQNNLHDVAGIRVICSFPDDIYMLAEKLCSQDDISLIEKKDYIKNPKPNGYRSLHLILQVPIFLSNEKKLMEVEVQFRTIAMDFWASLEHKVKYKKNLSCNTSEISEKLRACADEISSMDLRMQQIRNEIEIIKETSAEQEENNK